MVTRKVLNKIQIKYSDITDSDLIYNIGERYEILLLHEYKNYLTNLCEVNKCNIDDITAILKTDYGLTDNQIKLYSLTFNIDKDSDCFKIDMYSTYCGILECDKIKYNDIIYYNSIISIVAKYKSYDNTIDYNITHIDADSSNNENFKEKIPDLYRNYNAQYSIINSISETNWYRLFGEYSESISKLYSAITKINENLSKIKKDSYNDFCSNYMKDMIVELLVESNDISSGYMIYNLI